MRAAGADYESVVLDSADDVFSAYDSGRCVAVTADRSALVSRQTTLTDPSAHVILDEVLSKEPLGPAVLQGDAQWADVVNWIVFGTIQAEEFGLSAETIASAADSSNPEIRRFVGLEDALGEGLGLSNDFMVAVIGQVGNYAEIYDRNLGPDTPFNLARGPNRLWSDGGLLYSPPFR
jgi:general L-amino acid transport system substrate-binding protein